jgi:hypothetical protein
VSPSTQPDNCRQIASDASFGCDLPTVTAMEADRGLAAAPSRAPAD